MLLSNVSNESYYPVNLSQFQTHCPGHLGPRRHHYNDPVYFSITYASCVINAVFSVLAVLGNGLVLVAFYKIASLRTPANCLLCGLAVSDLGVGLIIQPSFFVYRMADLNLWDDDIYCTAGLVTESLGVFLASVSLLTLTLIAIERYLFLKHRWKLTWKQFAVAYSVAVVLPAPHVILRYFFHSSKWYIYGTAVVYGCIWTLCFLAMILCYLRIFQMIRTHQVSVEQSITLNSCSPNSINIAKYKRSIKTVLLILLTNLLAYLPLGILTAVLWVSRAYTVRILAGFNFAGTVVFMNSTFNPVFYSYRIKEIRLFVNQLVQRIMCSVKTKQGM